MQISRGGLTVQSKKVSDFVASRYVLLDWFDQHVSNKVRNLSLIALERYSPRLALGCEAHVDRKGGLTSRENYFLCIRISSVLDSHYTNFLGSRIYWEVNFFGDTRLLGYNLLSLLMFTSIIYILKQTVK